MNPIRQLNQFVTIVIAALTAFFTVTVNADIVTLRAKAKSAVVQPGGAGNITRVNSKTIKLAENQLATVTHFYCFDNNSDPMSSPPSVSDDIKLTVTFDDLTVKYTHSTLFGRFGGFSNDAGVAVSHQPQFVGPATIQLTVDEFGGPGAPFGGIDSGAICTIEVVGKAELLNASAVKPPTVSAVVKADLDGPVEVVLESSTDMEKTWQPAALGIYGTTDKRRYFRLRAEKR